MILGMSTGTYILLHVLISLVEIGSGLVVKFGFLTGKVRRMDGAFSCYHRINERDWLWISN